MPAAAAVPRTPQVKTMKPMIQSGIATSMLTAEVEEMPAVGDEVGDDAGEECDREQ